MWSSGAFALKRRQLEFTNVKMATYIVETAMQRLQIVVFVANLWEILDV